MSALKKTVLRNLFIASSMGFLLHGQDQDLQDNQDLQDLILICDSCPEEIYPLEDIDAIGLISEIQNNEDLSNENVELDQHSKNIISDVIDQVAQESNCDNDKNSQIIEFETAPANTLPMQSDEIVALDHTEQSQPESSHLVSCQIDEDKKVVCDATNLDFFIEKAVQGAIEDMCEELEAHAIADLVSSYDAELIAPTNTQQEEQDIFPINSADYIPQIIEIIENPMHENINIEQLEELLNSQSCRYDSNESYQTMELQNSEYSDSDCPCCATISVESPELVIAAHDGIPFVENLLMLLEDSDKIEKALHNESVVSDDDIIPVPHDLINSVKKAAKKKKKLEEKARKEKAKFLKKSKKNKILEI